MAYLSGGLLVVTLACLAHTSHRCPQKPLSAALTDAGPQASSDAWNTAGLSALLVPTLTCACCLHTSAVMQGRRNEGIIMTAAAPAANGTAH